MNRAETLEQLARLCRSGHVGAPPVIIEPSGSAELDAALPGGGWQSGTIVELIGAHCGIGELSLLMPALARITSVDRHVAFVAPPYIPYAPALSRHGIRLDRLVILRAQKAEDILWAFEQTLRCKSFGAVLAWPVTIRDREIRRLQLAAEAGRSTGFVYRPMDAALQSSPAALRLRLQPGENDSLAVDVIKCRGGRSGVSVQVKEKAVRGSRLAVSEDRDDRKILLTANR